MFAYTDDYNQRDLWITRIYYFVMIGGGGFAFPFMNLFYIRQGLTGQEIGWVVALNSLIALFSALLWTEWSSKSGQIKPVLIFGLIGSAAGMILLSYQTAFLWIAVVSSMRVLLNAGLFPLSDSLALRVTGATRAGFGSVRVWGSAGWAIAVLTSGLLIETTGIRSAFLGYAICLLACIAILLAISNAKPNDSQKQSVARSGFAQVGKEIVRTPVLAGLGLMLVVTGLANNGVIQFENVYLDELNASESVIGIASMVSAVVEVPGMLWADRMVRRHGSGIILMAAIFMNGILRFMVLAFPAVFTIILQRGIGGIAFSLYTVALIRSISENTHPGQTSTALAIFTVALASLIGIVGTPLSGFAFDHVGARWLYAVSAAGYFLGVVILRSVRNNKPAPG